MTHGRDSDAVNIGRRRLLKGAGLMTGAISAGLGTWVFRPTWAHAAGPIKVGIATDMTGAISHSGNACANVARMVIEDINAGGGIKGRPLEMILVDTASNETTAVANVRRLIQRDRVDVVFGGITSSMREAIKDPIVNRGRTLYVYPQLYEGQECTPYVFCTGPTPAQQTDTLVPWLIKNGGKRFALPSANYVWPHLLNKYVRSSVEKHGGEVVFEEYYPIDQVEYSSTVNKIMSNNVEVVYFTVIPPGVGPFLKQLFEAGFLKRGGRLSCVYYDENMLNVNAAHEFEGLASCLDFFENVDEPGSQRILAEYNKKNPGPYRLAAGGAATGMYRGLKLWEQAVKATNGDVSRDAVAAALDKAKIAEGPGGPAEMVPGTRHCRMNMYIAVAKNGKYDIVDKSNGLVDPKECLPS
jgi:ABC-type branched-subunit amino acid transport system substrate-binding protein